MTTLAISLTESGRIMADRLPYEHVHGAMGDTVRQRWHEGGVDGFVLFAATGVAVRIVAPLLDGKHADPAVVCVDEAGHFVIPLVGGHAGGANDLARAVAGRLGAEAVITTASDVAGVVALDTLPGFTAEGDIASVTAAMVDGRSPIIDNPLGWPLPSTLSGSLPGSPGPEVIRVSDEVPARNGAGAAVPTVTLHPPSLVLGVGSSSDAPPPEVAELVRTTLADAGLAPSSVAVVATIDRRRDHPAIIGLGLPVRCFTPDTLAAVEVPNPSTAVLDAVGTPSVCEAAALLTAGDGAELVVTKQRSAAATLAVARRRRPGGGVSLVGLGPGSSLHRTPAAEIAVRRADVVIGYSAYVDQCADLLSPHHQVIRSPLGSEVDRARQALELAATGRRVAMVCSGDAGVYAMASPVLELTGDPRFAAVDIEVVPGVTAGLAAAAVLGAPLGHDHVLISLSDLMTPWDRIEARVRAAAESDLVVVLYNPRSERRIWQLDKAIGILAGARPAATPVGLVTDAGRAEEQTTVTTIGSFDATMVTMTTCVIIGSTTTLVLNGRMVTPRGYAR